MTDIWGNPLSHRDELRLEGWRFTTISALAREILALLECTDYKLIVVLTPPMKGWLDAELEDCRTMGRVKLEYME